MAKKKQSKISKTRNLAAAQSRNMSGAGQHQDKTGEKASRTRQKRQWKKDIREDYKEGKSISSFTPEMQTIMSQAGVDVGEPIHLNYLYNREISSYGDSVRKVGVTSHGKDLYQHVKRPNYLWIITDTGEDQAMKESMIGQANSELVYDNSDDFDQALKDIEQQFGINLSEGFSPQQIDDMNKLISQYKGGVGDDANMDIGADLEMLEYQPDEVESMVAHILSAMKQ